MVECFPAPVGQILREIGHLSTNHEAAEAVTVSSLLAGGYLW
jgi:hypothetical protein